ncbi:MAG: OmpA family protein [Flavobacteriaceae bacterium]|nr:OmpA family protein [Flavobacteriaceae bacterium]
MKNILITVIIITTFSACVSKKVYEDLERKYTRLSNSNSELIDQNESLVSERNKLLLDVKNLDASIRELNDRKVGLENENRAAQDRLDKLIASYDALQSESASELTEKALTIRKLLEELQQKENQLAQESNRLTKLQSELDARSQTIAELQDLIAAKEAKMNALKTAVSNALKGFEGKGLTVTHKNGKVYVSMENKLLFDSGSWAVGMQGVEAVEKLALVLVQNQDIEVLIEGHTDNVPYSGTTLLDNWDLSVKRATAIVRILQNKGVNPIQITAAGRSEYIPIQSNTTSEGKAKNRRIEIILAPNLDQINKLLGE